MLTVPDFRQASFIPRVENPFRLTPPRHQAIFVHQQQHTENKKDKDTQPPEAVSLQQLVDALKNAAKEKQDQGFALLELVNAEGMLIKNALIVSVASALTAFVLGIACWILINATIGYIAYTTGASILAVLLTLLAVNGITLFLVLKQGKSAYQYLNGKRMIRLFKQLMD